MRYLTVLVLSFACSSGPSSQVPLSVPHSKPTSLHWRTMAEHCNDCEVKERDETDEDLGLAEEALAILWSLHLSGNESPICTSAGVRESAGSVLITNKPNICGESCSSSRIEMVSTIEAAKQLRLPPGWRLVELEYHGAVEVVGERGVVLTCGTGSGDTIYSATTLLALRNSRGEVQFVTWFRTFV